MDKKIKELMFDIKNFDDKDRTFEAIASTEDVDRYGDIIKQEGWELDEFMKNPVIAWGHDYMQPPIAKAEEVKVKDKKLFFKAKFPKKGIFPFADLIFDLFKERILKAFSVGFWPKDFDENESGGFTFKRQELLEISAVTVPANPNALALAYQKSMDKFKEVSPKPKNTEEGELDYKIKTRFIDDEEEKEFKEMLALQSEVLTKDEAVEGFQEPDSEELTIDEVIKEIRKNKIIESTFLTGLEERVEKIEERLEMVNDNIKELIRDKPEKPEDKPESIDEEFNLTNDEIRKMVREAVKTLSNK